MAAEAEKRISPLRRSRTASVEMASWLIDGLHPTLRDEAAKDGAPGRFWSGGGEQATTATTNAGFFAALRMMQREGSEGVVGAG